MKKNTGLHAILRLIFPVLFNLLFFVLGGTRHPASVWVAYGFIHAAYFMLLATPLLVQQGREAAVFGLSIYGVSTIYLIAELVIGVIIILAHPETVKASLLIQAVLMGLYLATLLSVLLANGHTAEQVGRRQEERAYIQSASSQVKLLLERLPDRAVNKEIERVYDALRASPTRSNGSAYPVESAISGKIVELETAVSAADTERISALCTQLQQLIRERNQTLRTNE